MLRAHRRYEGLRAAYRIISLVTRLLGGARWCDPSRAYQRERSDMKPVNDVLWSGLDVQELEGREEFGGYLNCFSLCFDCICFDFKCFCFSL